MSHALLSPSAASRWVNCPGSIYMCQQFPQERSESAEEGTAAHWVGSTALEGKPMPAVGTRTPNGLVTTIEMVECAGVYVQAALTGAQGAAIYKVEEKLNCTMIHPTECNGTPDLWYYLPERGEIHVWDYKHGFGIVEAHENWQLMIYASGALQEVCRQRGFQGEPLDQPIVIVLHIVQPRPFHQQGSVREWKIPVGGLKPYVERLRTAAAEATRAMGGLAQCNTGAHCRYCNGRQACPALQQASMVAVDYSASTLASVLSPEALAIEIRTLQRCQDLVKARLTGLEQQALGMLNAGKVVPGYAAEHGKGRRVWNKPVGEVLALGQMMGVSLEAPAEAITPAQAAKRGLDASVIEAYSEVPTTGLKLVSSESGMRQIAAVFAATGGGA